MKATLILSILGTAVLGALLLAPYASAQKAKGELMIQKGSVVSLEYTLSEANGKLIESNKGKAPLKYTHGQSQIIPGLEKELTGMKVGGKKNIRVDPEDAYGEVKPEAFQEVPKANIPPEALKAGTTLIARSPQGQSFPVRVHEIKENTVVLDLNHPLAGKTLVFDVQVLDIQAPQAK